MAEDGTGDRRGMSDDYSSEDEGTEDYRRGGYHAVRIGDTFRNGCYVVQSKLGWGHFSTVWLAWDTLRSRYVALKIQKSTQHYTEAAMDEIKILKQIAEGDRDDKKCVVKLLDHFKHSGPNGQHMCMVFEYLGDNLLTLIKYSDYRGVPLHMVKEICQHILVGLDYLHRELSIIHTDLKPENVLLLSMIDPSRDPTKSGASLILPTGKNKVVLETVVSKEIKSSNGDLTRNQKKKIRKKAKKAAQGCVGKEVSEENERDSNINDTEDTNAKPNEILGEERAHRSLVKDETKGDGINNGNQGKERCRRGSHATRKKLLAEADLKCKLDHLALMMELLGIMPRKIALGGRYSRDFFNRYGDLRHIRRLHFWPLDKVLMEKYNFSEQDAKDMADFLIPILDFAPEKRPTAAQCLNHPWISSGPQLLQLSTTAPKQHGDDGTSKRERKDKDDREAMEAGVGNIEIDGGSSKPLKETLPKLY
ncbi:Serine/threonine-protein kinase SRPK [Gossypium arboreum]|uniref:non-specific serine/threonine protein kinase n=1 Tax=Gossypium arboreum TaxID=29729 RepID=A0A0B0NI20_GOSAR|nr:Serine/threonine-protein kinase SRPK [Gossypium arboreum]